jgi:hypothetical protein
MEAAIVVWIISLLDVFITTLAVVTILAGTLVIFIMLCSEEDTLIFPKKLFVVGVISGFGWMLMPSTQTGYIMAGAYFGQSIVQSDEARRTYDLIIKKIEKDLKENK